MTRPVSCPSALALSARDPSTYQTTMTTETKAVAICAQCSMNGAGRFVMRDGYCTNYRCVFYAVAYRERPDWLTEPSPAQSPPLLPVARDEDIANLREALTAQVEYLKRLKHRARVRGGPDTSAMSIADEAIDAALAALASRPVPPLGSDQWYCERCNAVTAGKTCHRCGGPTP